MTKTANKCIEIPILNHEYKVIVCWGDDKYIRKLSSQWGHDILYTEPIFENRRGVTFYTAGYHPFIALPKKPKTPEQIGTLAHEAVHAINAIFDKIGEDSVGEVFAHSVGAVVRKALDVRS